MTLTETCENLAEICRRKGLSATRTPAAFFIGSMFAGAFVGIALILAWTCSAGLPAGVRPLVNGSVFGIGLILVVLAGAELFTGGVMYSVFGLVRGRTTIVNVIAMLVLMWIGNLVGSVLLAWIYAKGGGGAIYAAPADYLGGMIAKKQTASWFALLARSTLCNWLVCMAVFGAARVKSETAKIIIIAWCLLAFVACGFEHSVANMTAFALGLFDPAQAGTVQGAAYNLFWVTIGNIIGGGLFVGGAYLWYARVEAQPTQPDLTATTAPGVTVHPVSGVDRTI